MPMTADVHLPSGRLAQAYSLEITTKDGAALNEVHAALPAGTPISVTFLASESWGSRLAAAAAVKRLNFVPVPHIAARQLKSVQELQSFLETLQREVGIDGAFVIAGDVADAQGPYEDARGVIASGLLQEHGVKTVGIAGYPDGHPRIASESLWSALRDKQRLLKAAGQKVEIVTQFGFDADPFLNWIERVRDAGIDDLIRIGIPGPASIKRLLHFAGRCGVGASAKVMAKYGLSLTRLWDSAGPEKLLAELEAGLEPRRHGDVRLHLYPFGGLNQAVSFMNNYIASRDGR